MLFSLFLGLVVLGMVSSLRFLWSHLHIYMSLLYPVLAMHLAGKSMMLVGVLLQFFSSPPNSVNTIPHPLLHGMTARLRHTFAFFHYFWPFMCDLIHTTSPGCSGWSDFALWLKWCSCLLQSHFNFFRFFGNSSLSKSSLVGRSVFVLLDISFWAGDKKPLADVFLWSNIARYGSPVGI